MLYTCKNPILEIITVGRFAWQARQLSVAPRDFSALALRLQGGGTLECSGKTYELHPGDVLYMPQGLGYRHDYTDTDVLLFHFVTATNDTEPEIYRPKNLEEITRQFQKAQSTWEQKKSGYVGRCMSLLYKVLSLLAENEAVAVLPPHFLQAVELLGANYCRSDLRIGEICSRACISETVFRQLFKKHYGTTPVDYLTELRLEQVRSLIADGASIETAAEQSGFSDSKYLARVVKQRLGCTPRQLKTYG